MTTEQAADAAEARPSSSPSYHCSRTKRRPVEAAIRLSKDVGIPDNFGSVTTDTFGDVEPARGVIGTGPRAAVHAWMAGLDEHTQGRHYTLCATVTRR